MIEVEVVDFYSSPLGAAEHLQVVNSQTIDLHLEVVDNPEELIQKMDISIK